MPMKVKKTEKKLYAFTIQSYIDLAALGQRGLWVKVGETTQETADMRIAQQDGTSNAEPLLKLKEWVVDSWLTDATVHAQLRKMGCKEVRKSLDGKDREWYECPNGIDDVSSAINQLVDGVSRPNNYKMRPEQKACARMAVKYFQSGGDKFLINAIMRFGKTFVTYQIIKKMALRRVLVLTYKPQVEQAWREDLETHVDFEGFNYIHAKDFGKGKPVTLEEGGPGCDVLFASFQDINDMSKSKWRKIRDYWFDMVVLDEQHYGTSTDRAQKTLEKLTYTHQLEVSGTPLKALMSGEYLPYQMFSHGYADEQKLRRAEERTGWATEIYRSLPVMNIHTFVVDPEVKDEIIKYYSDLEGFSMLKMFASLDGVTFIDEASVKLFIDQVLGRQGHKNHSPYRTKAVDHSLWVLPSNVKSVSALCLLLEKLAPDYKIINVAGDNVRSLDKVLDTIDHNEKTITVTCGRFNTGVTVKKWDMIVMMDDGAAAETYFQTIFRAKSPDPSRDKEQCYVVDYNPQRCLKMIYDYAEIIAKEGQGISDAVREFMDFCPVLDHSGNKPVEVNPEDVLSFISESGGYIRSFGSPTMFNWSALDSYSNKFHGLDPIEILYIAKQLADSDLDKGKNYLSNVTPKRGKIDLDKKELDELRRRVMGMLARLPHYMLLTSDSIKSVDDITGEDDPVFEKVMGVSNEVFGAMCGPFIRADRLNRCIVAYNQILDMNKSI